MDRATARALAAINQRFYRAAAGEFDVRRRHPWKGWERLLAEAESRLPAASWTVLDAGCGNGRFGLFLAQHCSRPVDYLGIDLSLPLLATAGERLRPRIGRGLRGARLLAFDLLAAAEQGAVEDDGQEGGLGPLAPGQPPVSLVVLFGVFHHIPGVALRRGLLELLADRLAPGGMLAVSIWRYGDDPRFRRRLRSWDILGADAGVDRRQLEPGDHLLAWGTEPERLRYCHHADAAELAGLLERLAERGLELAVHFDADGRDGDLNRYLVWLRS